MDRLKLIKQAALKSKAKKLNTTVEELEFQEAVARLDERKAAKKEEMKLHKKLTASVKKAGKDSPGSLDCFKEENMFYSLCFFFVYKKKHFSKNSTELTSEAILMSLDFLES